MSGSSLRLLQPGVAKYARPATRIVRFAVATGVLLAAMPNAATAQIHECVVSGYVFTADASPLLNGTVSATSVERSGASLVLTPFVISSDSSGATTFTVPQASTVWIAASV